MRVIWQALILSLRQVSEAKRSLSPKELQQIVLQSMREYGSTRDHALLLKDFETIPLELEQCKQQLSEIEEARKIEIALRETLLARHVACLKGINGDQGARFAESLVAAIARSDRLADELLHLREHVTKVEHVRDGHWRAVSGIDCLRLTCRPGPFTEGAAPFRLPVCLLPDSTLRI